MIEAFAEKYVPHLRYDRAEPYSLIAVGYTVYHQKEKSRSCRLTVDMEPGETVIEYAFYYDFDIQHLYDLEHVFVRIGKTGEIAGLICSFHGKFLNALIEGETEFEGTHPVLYVQPGKHAFMPKPFYFRLALDRDKCCNVRAGSEGLLIAPMFEKALSTDESFNRRVERYIKERDAFTPAWEFVEEYPGLHRTEDILLPWERLELVIIGRIKDWKRRIEEETGNEN